MNKIIIYARSILLPVIVGAVVGLLTSSSINYSTLIQPPLAPPSSLFPIVWTILYILMGISYGILKSNNQTNAEMNSIYYWQLAINALWSFFFFVFKWRLFSFFWILLLIVFVVRMILAFYRENKVAGLLQIPYLLWLLFAAYLNLGTYILNK